MVLNLHDMRRSLKPWPCLQRMLQSSAPAAFPDRGCAIPSEHDPLFAPYAGSGRGALSQLPELSQLSVPSAFAALSAAHPRRCPRRGTIVAMLTPSARARGALTVLAFLGCAACRKARGDGPRAQLCGSDAARRRGAR